MTFFIFLVSILAAEAKDPCKSVHVTTDPFAGEIRTGRVSVSGGRPFLLQRKGDEFFMQVVTFADGVVDKHGRPGDLVEIAIGGSVMSFPATK